MRYGAPPVGNLRFRAPTTPKSNGQVLNNGSKAVICIQAPAPWLANISEWITNGTAAFNISAGYTPPNIISLPPADPTSSEDCLFLDVMVPKPIFDAAYDGGKAPV